MLGQTTPTQLKLFFQMAVFCVQSYVMSQHSTGNEYLTIAVTNNVPRLKVVINNSRCIMTMAMYYVTKVK